jgi:predicted XRE-type DNA-binding protein
MARRPQGEEMGIKQTTIIRSGGNIFADLGLPDADLHMLKARLVICIDKLIEQAGLTQQAAAKLMRISQPTARNYIPYKHKEHS